MENLTLEAQSRLVLGKQVKKIRSKGELPVILYGKGIDSRPLAVNLVDFKKIYKESGTSTLVNLVIDEQKPVKVLFHEPQKDPVTGELLHDDIYQVNMSEKIKTDIPLVFVGESIAVQDLEGNLITNRDSLEVECLPDALVPSIDVDISSLKTFDDIIHVKDIKVPEGIEVIGDPEEPIALVTPPRSEEELEEELAETTEEQEQAAVEELSETPAEESTEEETQE